MGDRAFECLNLLTRSCVWPNFLTCHDDARQQGITLGDPDYKKSVFQVDANMGLTAAVLEMLIFSVPGLIRILPALPEGWPRGAINGVLCRDGITLSIVWDRPQGKLHMKLESRQAQAVDVKLPEWITRTALRVRGGELGRSARGARYVKIQLPREIQVAVET